MELLLAAGCGVDLTTNDGWTALHEASANGHNGVVELLLQANSQVMTSALHTLPVPAAPCIQDACQRASDMWVQAACRKCT